MVFTTLALLLLCTGENESPFQLQQQELCDSEPLLNVSYDLERVLSGVCELLEWYEFIAQEINGSDYHAVLGQTLLDSCNWVGVLITTFTNVMLYHSTE